MAIDYKSPDKDIAEVSLFGPGVGESIVAHIGGNKWVIIDSCICSKTGNPIAYDYLKKIGVNLSSDVIAIVISHFHSDHIKGATKLVAECKEADIYIPSALLSEEQLHIADLHNSRFTDTYKDIDEFEGIINHFYKIGELNRLKKTFSQINIFTEKSDVFSRMVALSPSSASVQQSISNIAAMIPGHGAERMRDLIRQSDNLNAIALYFEFGDASILLGSDLEFSKNKYTGWSAIFNDSLISKLSLEKSFLYKVSHHGSKSGHDDRVVSELLLRDPLAIATTFHSSKLPKPDDIKRIKDYSSEFLTTSNPRSNPKINRGNAIKRTIKESTESMHVVSNVIGHIQIRFDSNSNYTANCCENVVKH